MIAGIVLPAIRCTLAHNHGNSRLNDGYSPFARLVPLYLKAS